MSGPMGGSASEEFLAPMAIGEDTFALAPSGKAWNVEALTTQSCGRGQLRRARDGKP